MNYQNILKVLLIFLYPANGFYYGIHIPHGIQAVWHIYGPKGTWKNMSPLYYYWNFYEQWATPVHYYDRETLIKYANGAYFFTSRDINGNLLCDFDRNGEIDTSCGGFAFHDHNGIDNQGNSNPQRSSFTTFWFDDNWIARYMAQAYKVQEPNGLYEQDGFVPWKILGMDSSKYIPFNQDNYDKLALDGLYFLAIKDYETAYQRWVRCWAKTEAYYDQNVQEFIYPRIYENYHLGLWKILTDLLFHYYKYVDHIKGHDLLQHSLSLRYAILKNQATDNNGFKLGWLANIDDPISLISTKATAINTIALGTWSKYSYESYAEPMEVYKGTFIRDYFALSAVVGKSAFGIMFHGPTSENYLPFLTKGYHEARFVLRSPTPCDEIAYVFVRQGMTGHFVVPPLIVDKEHLYGKNKWSEVIVGFNVENDMFVTFGLYWTEKENLDVGYVSIM